MDRFRRFLVSDHAAGWAFILPSVILIAVFGIIPILWGLILSFQKAGLISPEREWVGLSNYAKIASDPKARQAAVNTIYYTLLFVPTSMKSRIRRSRVRPVASRPATMSPPT